MWAHPHTLLLNSGCTSERTPYVVRQHTFNKRALSNMSLCGTPYTLSLNAELTPRENSLMLENTKNQHINHFATPLTHFCSTLSSRPERTPRWPTKLDRAYCHTPHALLLHSELAVESSRMEIGNLTALESNQLEPKRDKRHPEGTRKAPGL